MGKERYKRRMSFVVFCAALLWLCGCSRLEPASPSVPACRVVTGIDIRFEDGPIRVHRSYTTAEKMQQVLNYLRLIDPYGPPEEDPETSRGSSFRIAVAYSDGCEKIYLQKSERFMKVDDGQWKKIDPRRAQNLSRILGQMESDGPG